MTVVDIGTGALAVERSGADGGPPLLLIMGMSGTALHWGEPFLEELRRDFDVIAFDHRGVGASSRLDGRDHDRRDGAGRRGAARRARRSGRAHVLGISMGGMIAQELALARPELVRTLTLGCTYCGGPDAELTDPERARAAERGDGVRRSRARDPYGLGGERVAGVRRRRAGLAALSRVAARARRRRARRTRPAAGVRGPRHARAARRPSRCRRWWPRHARRDAPGRQRQADRLADPRRGARDPRRASGTCSSGSSPSARRSSSGLHASVRA